METLEFQAEARQLLQLMIHSIYSNKDVFLRELIANASDALDKLRLATYLDKDLVADVSDLHIAIEADPAARTLTVRDNGIGMSRDEVVSLIGTVARSGTAEMLRRAADAEPGARPDLIGQFGVGFYATFMVATKVALLTRKAGEATGTRWESDGGGTYTIDEVEGAPPGTSVTLTLRAEDREDRLWDYTDTSRIRELVTRYSDFISWPIRLHRPDTEPERLNSMKALWSRPRDEVTDAEYHDFYKHLTRDIAEPLDIVAFRAEGTFEYDALLFVPARPGFDLYDPEARRAVQLYVKRVFIMADCRELLPDYLRFVTGVVDARDLSLNISREILQQDRQVQLMRKRLVRKVLGAVKDMREADAEKFGTLWKQYGAVLKEGLIADPEQRDTLLAFASFASTHDPEQTTTIDGYVSRMPEDQQEIFYATGPSRAALEASPHLEGFRAKGTEVLLLTDRVDEFWVDAVGEVAGKPLRSVAVGDAAAPADVPPDPSLAPMLTGMATALAGQVREVRVTSRLTTSPARVAAAGDDLGAGLRRLYRAMGHDVPDAARILEVNPAHPLIVAVAAAYAANPDDPSCAELAEIVYGLALVAEGALPADPARFTRLLADRLAGHR